jgi:hypothetical protein
MWRPKTTRRSGSRRLRAIATCKGTKRFKRRVNRLVETQRLASFRQTNIRQRAFPSADRGDRGFLAPDRLTVPPVFPTAGCGRNGGGDCAGPHALRRVGSKRISLALFSAIARVSQCAQPGRIGRLHFSCRRASRFCRTTPPEQGIRCYRSHDELSAPSRANGGTEIWVSPVWTQTWAAANPDGTHRRALRRPSTPDERPISGAGNSRLGSTRCC